MTEFAKRSWLHGFAVWLIRSALLVLLGLAIYLLIAYVIVPGFADSMLERMQNQAR